MSLKMLSLATLLVIAVGRVQIDASLPLSSQFKQWSTHHQRNYSTAAEESLRFDIFSQTARKVYAHNEKFDAGLSTYRQGLNHMSDFTKEEYQQRLSFKTTRTPTSNADYFPHMHVKVDNVENIAWKAP
jgi:hypothetical protein